jgi:hypothetical protein
VRRATRLGLFAAALLLQVAPGSAEPRLVDLSIRNRELPAAQRVVRVRQGDDVTIRWTTDAPLTVHLHGYDIEAKLTSGAAVSMRFTARATGRFPIETHGHGGERTLGYLEVHPR